MYSKNYSTSDNQSKNFSIFRWPLKHGKSIFIWKSQEKSSSSLDLELVELEEQQWLSEISIGTLWGCLISWFSRGHH